MNKAAWFPAAAVAFLLLIAWIVTTEIGIVPAFALPAPRVVVEQLVAGFRDGYLSSALGNTLLEAFWGCLAAAALGIPVGIAIAHFAALSAATEPYLAASQAIPAIAIAPLLVTWLGYGTIPIVVLCAIMVIFPVIISTAVGIKQIAGDVVGAARLDGAGGFRLVWHIEIPLAAPNIMAGVRTGFTLAMTGAVVGEMVIGGERGLGIEL
ncbi:MAG: ABC transporter permease subunit, partial [Arcanobacterium sp.]|nr:ABC transporter permease subunit [Arcanobacterium sp.]